jgi:hypothetical protein
MALPKWAETAGRRFAEALIEISSGDVCACIADALRDAFPGQYCYPEAVYGDDESGDVVYCCGGDLKRCSYSISGGTDGLSCTVDSANSMDVYRITTYVPEAGEPVTEAERTEKYVERFPGSTEWKHQPFSERFISKAERDSADDSSFAGSGKSFPILRKSDVMAAVHSIGRGVAGGQKASTIKAGIKRIAKKKGWTDALPDAWKDKAASEAALGLDAGEVRLVESSARLPNNFRFEEASITNPLAKIIDPGRGTAGYYTKEILQRDGPKIFTPGTLMYVNHATEAEEAARPEGDWNSLAAVTVGNAYWDDNGPEGAALYAPSKVFSDYASQVKEKAPYTGLSIRAGGTRDDNAIAPDGRRGVITKLTRAESIDLVTKAGRGGKLLVEAANAVQLYEAARGSQSQQQGETDMDEAQVKQLIETATAPLVAENTKLRERIAEFDKPKLGKRKLIKGLLESIKLHEASKERVIERVRANFPLTEAGEPNTVKLKELVEAEAKRESEYLTRLGVGAIQGFGPTEPAGELKEADVEKDAQEVFARLTGDKKVAEIAARGRRVA